MQTFFKHPPDLNVFVMFKIKPEQDLICEAAGNALIFNNLTFSEKSRFRFEMGETDTCKSQNSDAKYWINILILRLVAKRIEFMFIVSMNCRHMKFVSYSHFKQDLRLRRV